jgi:predicted PurR-regulated permease PerM
VFGWEGPSPHCWWFLLTLAGVGAIGWIVARQFIDALNQLPEYQSNIKEKIDSLPFSKNLTLRNASATMNQLSKALALPPEAPSGKRSANTSSRPTQPLAVEVIKPTSLPIESVQSVLSLLLQVLIVIVFTVFMLLRRENLWHFPISLQAGLAYVASMRCSMPEIAGGESRLFTLRTR